MHPLIVYIRGATGLYSFYRDQGKAGFDGSGPFKMEYRKQWELAGALYRVERRQEKVNELKG